MLERRGVDRAMAALQQEMSQIRDDYASLILWRETIDKSISSSLKSIETSREVVEVANDIKSMVKALGWIGTLAKWITTVVGGTAILYASMKEIIGK